MKNREIVEYALVGAARTDIQESTEKQVNEYIDLGWDPFGPPVFEYYNSPDGKDTFIWQAMVRYEECEV